MFLGFKVFRVWGLGFTGNVGIMEQRMEATLVYWGNMGRMENRMETTIGLKVFCNLRLRVQVYWRIG